MTERLELIAGDYVTDDRGNFGFARLSQNHTTKEHFIGVIITEGPDKPNRFGKSWHFRPLLDHPGGTLDARCQRCDRPFKGTPQVLQSLGGTIVIKEDCCRTCSGHTQTSAQRERERIEDQAGWWAKKTEHLQR